MEQIIGHASEIISFLVGAIAGSLVTIYFKNLRAGDRGNAVDQAGAKAGGDVIGRDKISK